MNQRHVTFPRNPISQPPAQHISKPKKLRRISRACDFCHKRSIRCQPSTEVMTSCKNCFDFNVACTYDRPTKKRGIKSGNGKAENLNGGGSVDGESDARMLLEMTNSTQGNGHLNVVDSFQIPEKWRTMVSDNETKIRDLVDVYFEVVYPIFPLFHKPSMIRNITSRDYLTNHAFFAVTMAVCALASARARDGALIPGRWKPDHFHTPSSESFYTAAKEMVPRDLSKMRGLDWMQTCALLAVYGIQVGNIEIMHRYLGIYHTLVSMDSLHDEKKWPGGIGIVESELRRRLFWSTYSFEVYSSIVWNSVIQCRESQSRVLYPSEVDDEDFSDDGYALLTSPPIRNPACWLHGWNFVIDLYRVLEHAVDNFHRQRSSTDPLLNLFPRNMFSPNIILSNIMAMHNELPARFQETELKSPITIEIASGSEDNFKFQAANITATLQLVRMILFTSEDATVEQKCSIARDLLNGFSKIPVFYLKALSCPLLHHLAGIGSILGSVIERPVTEASYMQVREVLLAMVDLLASLEEGISRSVGAASGLRSQVAQIDEYMEFVSLQRQVDLVSPNSSNSSSITPNTPYMTLPIMSTTNEQNLNIDPSLQGEIPTSLAGSASLSGSIYGIADAGIPFQYASHVAYDGGGIVGAGPLPVTVSGSGSSFIAAAGDVQLPVPVTTAGSFVAAVAEIQLPPNLLDNWKGYWSG